jgi:hypothetical protein
VGSDSAGGASKTQGEAQVLHAVRRDATTLAVLGSKCIKHEPGKPNGNNASNPTRQDAHNFFHRALQPRGPVILQLDAKRKIIVASGHCVFGEQTKNVVNLHRPLAELNADGRR